jgi:DNA-binding NarL/FixJ family response regulator
MVQRGHSCNRGVGMSLRCLIVDDNASVREEVRALLTEQGLEVVGGAGSATEGLRQIAELQPDVALIDIDLGEESGFELARRLSERPDQAASPHLILISTHDEAEYAELIATSPAIGFLAKTDLSAARIRRMLADLDDGAAEAS